MAATEPIEIPEPTEILRARIFLERLARSGDLPLQAPDADDLEDLRWLTEEMAIVVGRYVVEHDCRRLVETLEVGLERLVQAELDTGFKINVIERLSGLCEETAAEVRRRASGSASGES